ncbi:hypothetical protein FGADI_11587 [Fusarium gaditjirri]|uniref:Uncharacterized protein n=1 Tax=Fusarium gaditjirri TaxID=282569 RepID=A0A8H4SUS0_9HYPO|nr:hypothetical protein FGADI_11587 [Fusarium gaditjirri]
MAVDAESYTRDTKDLEQLNGDNQVNARSTAMPPYPGSEQPVSLTPQPTHNNVAEAALISGEMMRPAASDGDGEGTVLKTLKSRKIISAWDEPNLAVTAAYNHEDMLDSNDYPQQVPVHGTYFNNVWKPGNRGSKVTNKDMRIVRKYVRATRLFIPRDGVKHMTKRLPVEIPAPESATPAVYVSVNKVSFKDTTESFDLKVEPSNVMAGINTIFYEGCTVPGNISQLKRFVKDKATVFEEQPTSMARLVRQNNRVRQYLPIEPLQNRKASDDAGHQPSQRITNRREPETILIGSKPVLGQARPELLGGKCHKRAILDQMVFKWDGMIHEVMNAMAEGSLPNAVDMEPLMTNGTMTQETTADAQEPPMSPDEPADVQKLQTLYPHRARQYRDATTELTVRVVDWKPLVDMFNTKMLMQAEVLSLVGILWHNFGKEVADGVHHSRADPSEIDEATKVRFPLRLPTVLARLAGVLSTNKEEEIDLVQAWPTMKDQISKEYQESWNHINLIRDLLPSKDPRTWFMVLDAIDSVYKFPVAVKPIDLVVQIDDEL